MIKNFDVLFPFQNYKSFKPVSRGGVRKQIVKTDSHRFSIYHKPTGFIKMDRSYISLIQNLIELIMIIFTEVWSF